MPVLSDKLLTYIHKVEGRTRRPVRVQYADDLGMRGMGARFDPHPTHILVTVALHLQSESLEQSIAHEITHGLLTYGEYYPTPIPRTQLSETDAASLGILISMLEDIVANKIIQDEGFLPFAAEYTAEVRRETTSAQQGKNHYAQFEDPILRDRFMVWRYIMAWSALKYFRLGNSTRIPIVRFEQEFRRAYPKQYKAADQIKTIILENDLFTAKGYRNALARALELWSLNHLVEALPAMP